MPVQQKTLFTITRAETILSSLIVRPDPQDPNSTMLLQSNAKGLLPKLMIKGEFIQFALLNNICSHFCIYVY